MTERLDTLPQECAEIRQTIAANLHWINGTDYFLEETDEGYNQQQSALSTALVSAREAFGNRPGGCAMRQDAEDVYECTGCHFFMDVFQE